MQGSNETQQSLQHLSASMANLPVKIAIRHTVRCMLLNKSLLPDIHGALSEKPSSLVFEQVRDGQHTATDSTDAAGRSAEGRCGSENDTWTSAAPGRRPTAEEQSV